MQQLNMFAQNIWTVTELTYYLRDLLESDSNLGDVWIAGEISNFSRPRSGHLYFTIKDRSSALRCVMWKNIANQQLFSPQDGLAVEVHGSINIYEAQGQYQLYADQIRPIGEGALYQEFMRLKAKLELEGLFSPERKRRIPKIPKRIGIITSPTGAALQDMLNTIQRRYPLVEVILAPSQVQGSDAPDSLIAAISILNQHVNPDVILLARGGGSIEDLWAFNDMNVAYAIAESDAPIITGVGHETDFTIADFVADLRAPTPTAAAELATPNREELQLAINDFDMRSRQMIRGHLDSTTFQLTNISSRLSLRSPLSKIHSNQQRLDEIGHRIGYTMRQNLRLRRTDISGYQNQIISLNPSSILKRGYAAISKMDGQMVHSVHAVNKGEKLIATLSDGGLEVLVEHILPTLKD